MAQLYDLNFKKTPDYRFINDVVSNSCIFQLPTGQELNLDQRTGWAKCVHSIAETSSNTGQDRLVNILERLGAHVYRLSLVTHWSFHPDNPEPYVQSLYSRIGKYDSIIKKTNMSPLGMPATRENINYVSLISEAKDGITFKSRLKFEQLISDWMNTAIHDANISLTQGDANWEFWPCEAYKAINTYSNVKIKMPEQFKRYRPVQCHISQKNLFELIRSPIEARLFELGK